MEREQLCRYFRACELPQQNVKVLRSYCEYNQLLSCRNEFEELLQIMLQLLYPDPIDSLDKLIMSFEPTLSVKTVISSIASILHYLLFHGISEIIWDPTIYFPSITCKLYPMSPIFKI